jgi:hypothetical protein
VPTRTRAATIGIVRTIVLIDARNVLRSRWPNIPERELVVLTAAWAAERQVDAVVVFDGSAPELEEPHTAVVGTGGESADDWLIRRAAELHAEGRTYWLVTSDRALRAVAGRQAERAIGGGAFAGELRGEAG